MMKKGLKRIFLSLIFILLLGAIVYAVNSESVPIPANIGEKAYVHEGDSIIYNEAGLLVELIQIKSLCDKTNSNSPINSEKDYRILGLIPSTAEITASVDAQTGKTKIKKPWYSVISTS